VLKIFDSCNQTSAIRFVDEALRRLPFRVLVIQTDNGAEFQSRFHWHLESLDIRHVYIPARMGGLLQLPPTARSSRRADPLRAAPCEDRQGVTCVLRPYN